MKLEKGKLVSPHCKPPGHHVLASRTTALSSNTVKRLQASVPQNILLAPQRRDRKESLLGGVTGWLSQQSGTGMGTALGKSI